jgi:transcriptional regulator with XRE-family HTH domain
MEKESTYWHSRSDRATLEMMGTYLQKTRLGQNKTQQTIADAAGINRSTLVQLEQGKGGTLLTFIQVVRALGQLHQFSNFEYRQELSPLLLAEMERKQRYRARNKSSKGNQPQSEW